MKKGKVIEVKILESPTNCNSVNSRTTFCKLEYKGRVFTKKTEGQKYCDLVSGKQNVLMYTNEKESRILFQDEYNPIIYFYGAGMFGLSLWFFIKGRKNYLEFKNTK